MPGKKAHDETRLQTLSLTVLAAICLSALGSSVPWGPVTVPALHTECRTRYTHYIKLKRKQTLKSADNRNHRGQYVRSEQTLRSFLAPSKSHRSSVLAGAEIQSATKCREAADDTDRSGVPK
eukprot:1956807-Pyramimonas_sp.AAC.1